MQEMNDLMREFRDKTAIVGLGATSCMKQSGVSVLNLATQAVSEAIEDAGLTPQDIDGICAYSVGDSVTPHQLASALGISELRWSSDYMGGGFSSNNCVITAAAMVNAGVCNYVVVYRALNGRSGMRIGGSGQMTGAAPRVGGAGQFGAPYGVNTAPQGFATKARVHMEKYGTTSEQLGWIAVSARYHATMNPLSQMQAPITIEDHQLSRWVVEPFHLLDCCLDSDQGCALIITTAERAKALKQRPVNILAGSVGTGPMSSHGDMWPDLSDLYGKYTSSRLYEMAGVTPQDIDAAELYDCFTSITLIQLEDFGFVKKGEAGAFVDGGQRISIGGELPVNTHGGNLSEGYRQGLGHVIEGARQLRGGMGPRQVEGAELILTTGQGGPNGAGIILRKG